MEIGESGLLGVHALLDAEVGLKQERGHVPIQHLTMEALIVWALHLTSKIVLPKIAQLVNRSAFILPIFETYCN